MNTLKSTLLTALAALAVFLAAPAFAQSTIQGKVNNELGDPVTKARVYFTTNKSMDPKSGKFDYDVPLDDQGNYKAEVKPGDYVVFVIEDKVVADYQSVSVKAGENKTLNFDMTRPEYMANVSPERRKQIEETKSKNASAIATNKVVANLNATLATVRADLAAAAKTKADVSKDVDLMKQATTQKPDEGLLWETLGDTYQAQADSMAHANRLASKVPIDDAVTAEYGQAVDAYKKAIDLNAASKKPDVVFQATAWNQMGTSYGKSGKVSDAGTAYDTAARLNPPKAGMYFGNEAAILFNANQADASLVAANKAIAADPDAPDPYFIKGQALISKATLDSKTNKLVAPPGCAESYAKFLQLTQDQSSQMAQTAKDVLAGLGEKVDTSYHAPRKH
jgi:tetratricopeptide (TPR) repeat protein